MKTGKDICLLKLIKVIRQTKIHLKLWCKTLVTRLI